MGTGAGRGQGWRVPSALVVWLPGNEVMVAQGEPGPEPWTWESLAQKQEEESPDGLTQGAEGRGRPRWVEDGEMLAFPL